MNTKAKILIVEDEGIVGIDLEKSLRKFNYDVLGIVSSGEEAISWAFEKKPNLILMDIMLGGKMNGIEAAQRIKNELDIPIIYLTAYADEQTIQNAKTTCPFGYLLKPYNEASLYASIEMAIYKNHSERKLKKSEARFRELVELSQIAIGIHSEGKVVYTNSACVRLFAAKSADDLIGRPIMELVSPNFRDIAEERVKRASIKKEILEPLEEKFRRLDGRELDVEVSAIPTIFDGKDAVQVIIRDISEIKKKDRIQQAIVRILQSINLSISLEQQIDFLGKTLIDYIENKNICFAVYNNLTNEVSFPFQSDEFDCKSTEKNADKDLIEYTINSARTQLLSAEKINELTKEKGFASGEEIPKVWLGVPIELNEKSTLVIVFKEYVNENYLGEHEVELMNAVILPLSRAIERKMIEEERDEALKKLAELNQTKDNFFSVISHDLRSPFDSILGFTEILKNEFDELTNEEMKLYLDSLYQSSRHVYSLLTNMLQYSRFQLGKTKFNPIKIKLSTIINKNMEVLSGNALKKEMKLNNKVNNEIFVKADEDMLNSIIMNLLSNAIKFTNRGGEVNVTAESKTEFVEILIIDNGIGMSEDTLQGLFKLGYSKSLVGTENETGNGLGLIITKQYLEKHGGEISVISTPSKGTKFTFTLPNDL